MKIKESENINKNLDLARDQISVKHEGNGDTNNIWYTGNGS